MAPNLKAEAQTKYTIGVPDYSSSEAYGEKQKLLEFIDKKQVRVGKPQKGSRAHRSKLGS